MIVQVYVEGEQSLGDHGRVIQVPLSADLRQSLGDLLDLAGNSLPSAGGWAGADKLSPKNRIIITVRP